MHSEMVSPKDIWDEVDYVYDMDLLATSLAAQLLRYFFWKYTLLNTVFKIRYLFLGINEQKL